MSASGLDKQESGRAGDVEKQDVSYLESAKQGEVLSTNDAELDPEAERRCANGISRHRPPTNDI